MKNFSKESLISKSAKVDKRATLVGKCEIEDGAVVFGECYLENAIIRKNAVVKSSYIVSSEVGEGTTVGPFAHIRNNSKISANCRIGNFVEIKNSKLGKGTKAAHLTYVGDAEIGENVNLGCGVVFANYDGKKKHRSKVGNNVFIGCNCNIVAPRIIEDNCFIAAGTTLTNDLPKNSFSIGRQKDSFKERKDN